MSSLFSLLCGKKVVWHAPMQVAALSVELFHWQNSGHEWAARLCQECWWMVNTDSFRANSRKMSTMDLHPKITCLVTGFLKNRTFRVTFGGGSTSWANKLRKMMDHMTWCWTHFCSWFSLLIWHIKHLFFLNDVRVISPGSLGSYFITHGVGFKNLTHI